MSQYPKIQALQSRDVLFKQYSQDVREAYKALATYRADKIEEIIPFLFYYEYQVQDDTDIISLAARCNILQETIASLNKISNKNENLKGRTLLLPTMRGLFIPQETEKEDTLTILLQNDDRFTTENLKKKAVLLPITLPETLKKEFFYFVPNATFNTTELNFFLNVGFVFPLDKNAEYRLSSPFGKRPSPFTGHPSNHNGIDLAAPQGTPVLATQAGVVTFTGYSNLYGNYIIIKHNETISSLYAHLSSFKIRLNDKVKTGTIIGTVGSTGASTGSHLHFEILEGGIAKNPQSYLSGEIK